MKYVSSAILCYAVLASSCSETPKESAEEGASRKAEATVEVLAAPRINHDTVALGNRCRQIFDSLSPIDTRDAALDRIRNEYPEHLSTPTHLEYFKAPPKNDPYFLHMEPGQYRKELLDSVASSSKFRAAVEAQKDLIVKKWRAVAAQANYEATIQAQQQKQ